MKKLIGISIGLILALSVYAQTNPPLSQYHTITESWAAPVGWNGAGSSTPCSSTVTTYCVNGYTETLTPPNGGGSNAILSVPATSVTEPYAPGGALYCGTWNVSVVANWLDGNGAAVASAPLTGTTVVTCPFTAAPATSLTGKVS